MANRYVCTVIEELKTCNRTRNYSYMLGLLEEMQSMVNRMEAALEDKADLDMYRKQAKEKKTKVTALQEEIKLLEAKRDELKLLPAEEAK
jgi:hypothetical protein